MGYLTNCFKKKVDKDMYHVEKAVSRGFRVALNSDITRRKGICCTNLIELKRKISIKFISLEESDKLRIFTEDGTEIDDDEYFMSIPSQSLLVVSSHLLKPKWETGTPQNIFDHLLTTLRWSGGVDTVYQEVLELMQEDFQTKWTQMKRSVESSKLDTTHLSSKQDDPDWFKDLSTNAKTKEDFMFKNCQARVRGYLAKAESQMKEAKNLKPSELETIIDMISDFKSNLKNNKYHGGYFNRAADSSSRICDTTGLFCCEGKYNLDNCQYGDKHSINPYQNQETRILFSTWNLDHVVERSRAIVPSLVEAVKGKRRNKDMNTEYFYNLLFTRTNLKLVHIVCHDKQEHSQKTCDKKLYYC
eukprot:GFUD01022890.1.p1 GENE.GFUD01022890.1~~GFUD01022890.1.p1  ORF type:complete len:359 (+),score=78.09 GFUD01022890.1:43-1119(+)